MIFRNGPLNLSNVFSQIHLSVDQEILNKIGFNNINQKFLKWIMSQPTSLYTYHMKFW